MVRLGIWVWEPVGGGGLVGVGRGKGRGEKVPGTQFCTYWTALRIGPPQETGMDCGWPAVEKEVPSQDFSVVGEVFFEGVGDWWVEGRESGMGIFRRGSILVGTKLDGHCFCFGVRLVISLVGGWLEGVSEGQSLSERINSLVSSMRSAVIWGSELKLMVGSELNVSFPRVFSARSCLASIKLFVLC